MKLLTSIWVVLLVAIGLFYIRIQDPIPIQMLRLKTFDAFVETPEPSGNFVILNITEEDVEKRGGYPFPRQELADIHVDLINHGATGVGWVILFPQEDRFGGDKQFAEALSYSHSVLAMPEFNNG